MAIDANGNVVIAGYFQGAVDFGDGPVVSVGNSYDVFVVKLDPNGGFLWKRVAGDGLPQYTYGVEVDASGNVLVAGAFYGALDFGTGAMLRMGIRGRDGIALEDHWADGLTTFLGIQTNGFPNLFFPGGPHAAAGNNPRYNGDQVDFVTDTLLWARDKGVDVIEVTEEAEDRWTSMIDRAAAETPFGTIGQYVGGNIPGKPARYLLNAGGRPKLFKEIARVKDTDFAAFHTRCV